MSRTRHAAERMHTRSALREATTHTHTHTRTLHNLVPLFLRIATHKHTRVVRALLSFIIEIHFSSLRQYLAKKNLPLDSTFEIEDIIIGSRIALVQKTITDFFVRPI